MSESINPKTLVDRLKRAGMVIDKCEIGKPVTVDDREYASIISAVHPPKAIDDLYDKFDGFTLIWHGEADSRPVQGSINILSYNQSVTRAALTEEGAPLEGILWTAETPEAAAKQLRDMAIFESVAGRSQFITYRVSEKIAQLFLVERDEFHPIVPNFETTVAVLFRYAGAEGLRELLVHDDWENRLKDSKVLTQILGAL